MEKNKKTSPSKKKGGKVRKESPCETPDLPRRIKKKKKSHSKLLTAYK